MALYMPKPATRLYRNEVRPRVVIHNCTPFSLLQNLDSLNFPLKLNYAELIFMFAHLSTFLFSDWLIHNSNEHTRGNQLIFVQKQLF